jgi:hypothetical protein
MAHELDIKYVKTIFETKPERDGSYTFEIDTAEESDFVWAFIDYDAYKDRIFEGYGRVEFLDTIIITLDSEIITVEQGCQQYPYEEDKEDEKDEKDGEDDEDDEDDEDEDEEHWDDDQPIEPRDGTITFEFDKTGENIISASIEWD